LLDIGETRKQRMQEKHAPFWLEKTGSYTICLF